MKYLFNIIILFSFSCNQLYSQLAISFDNKGLACDAAVNSKNEIIMCGESALFSNLTNGKQIKSGYIAIGKLGDQCQQYLLSDAKNSFRIDQCEYANEQYYFSGYGFEDKRPILISCSKNMKINWAKNAIQLQPLGKSFLCTNSNGECLISTRMPSSTAYYNFFSLIDATGKEIWTKKLDHIDLLSDIIHSAKGNFIIHFVAKGAYIEERKKYYTLPVIQVNSKGNSENNFTIHIDRDQYPQISTNKIIESLNGDLYFLGSVTNVEKRMDLLVIKTNAMGEMLWCNAYKTDKELEIKTAQLNSTQGITFVADSYGRKGGFLYGNIDPNGKILSNIFFPSKPFDQAKKLLNLNTSDLLFYDKTLQFSCLEYKNGKTCNNTTTAIEISINPIKAISYKDQRKMEEAELYWKSAEIKLTEKAKIKGSEDCIN